MNKKNILIVEDDFLISRYIKDIVEMRGFNAAETATNCADAVESVKKNIPDLILMDILLDGEIDGIETAVLIKKFLDVPVIFITGNTDESILQRAKLTGPHGYIIKPIHDYELFSAIETALYKFDLEHACVESENKYRNLFESSMDAIMLLDTDGFSDCNGKTLEIFGFHSKDEFISKHPWELSPPVQLDGSDSMASAEKKIKETYEIGSSKFEWLHKKNNGDIFSAEVSLSRVNIGGKEIIQATVRDISEIKKAYSDINSLLSSIDSIIIGVSKSDEVTHWNWMAEKIFGIKAEEIIGEKVTGMPISWEWDKIYPGISQCLADRERVSIEDLFYSTPDGKKGILGVTINFIKDFDNELNGFLIYGNDITEKRIMESRLLMDQKLKSIGELAAGIAHEINTPTQYINVNTHFIGDSLTKLLEIITIIKEITIESENNQSVENRLNNLRKKMEDSDINYLLEELPLAVKQSLEGLNHISNITGSMKSFSHPGNAEKAQVNVNKVIDDIIIISKNEWKYSAEVKLELDENNPEIYCYPAELNQVLLNLIVNATHSIKDAIDSGKYEKGLIIITSHINESFTEITVRDNGMGIPDKIRDRIFDPFFTTKDVGKGTGQGLSIAHSIIVQKYGGTILVDTEEGVGATFIIRLPLSCK